MPEDLIRKFWDQQAALFEESDLATAPDHYYRELEIKHILSHLENGKSILDVGCGNG